MERLDASHPGVHEARLGAPNEMFRFFVEENCVFHKIFRLFMVFEPGTIPRLHKDDGPRTAISTKIFSKEKIGTARESSRPAVLRPGGGGHRKVGGAHNRRQKNCVNSSTRAKSTTQLSARRGWSAPASKTGKPRSRLLAAGLADLLPAVVEA
jgi:hypothetical protein